MKHIMLDIETMGNKSFSSILSIGAVKFDMNTNEKGDIFYRNITLNSNFEAGLKVDPDTIEWWMNQNRDAQKALFGPIERRVDLINALYQFRLFCNDENTPYFMWGNSPRFDLGIIRDAYHVLSLEIPWDFRLERDVRTLVSLAPQFKENYKYVGAAHDPIVDCINQINYCYQTYKYLKHVE